MTKKGTGTIRAGNKAEPENRQPFLRADRRKPRYLLEVEHAIDVHHDGFLRTIGNHHQLRLDRQGSFPDIELRDLPVLRSGGCFPEFPLRSDCGFGIAHQLFAVPAREGDDTDILDVLQQYGKPLIPVLCGLAAHRLHHLRPQRHAAKPFGSLIAFEKIVHKAALCRHEVRQEQTEGHYQQYSFHDYSVFWLHSYNKHTIPNETAWQSGPAPLLNSGVMP